MRNFTASNGVSWPGLLLRLAAAFILVYATYNPEGYSFFHWVFQPLGRGRGLESFMHSLSPLKALAAVGLITAWVFLLRATRRSLGVGGMLLVASLLGCFVWALVYYRVLDAASSNTVAHLVLFVVAGVLAVGLSWSLLNRRVAPQLDSDPAR